MHRLLLGEALDAAEGAIWRQPWCGFLRDAWPPNPGTRFAFESRVSKAFEWDAGKAASNWKKHGVSFDEAMDVFDDPLATTVADGWHSVDEVRWATIGHSRRHRLVVVFHTDRGGTIRLISARLPTPDERRVYEEDQT